MVRAEASSSPSPENTPSPAELESVMEVPTPANGRMTAPEKAVETVKDKPVRKRTRPMPSSPEGRMEAPKAQETAFGRERGFIPGSSFERLRADGRDEKWAIDDVKNNTVFLSHRSEAGDFRYAIMSKAQLENERNVMEIGRSAEQYWEPIMSLLAENDAEKRKFFEENKGLIIEITGTLMQGDASATDYSKLIDVMNEVADDHFASPNTPEDVQLRAKSAVAHGVIGAKRAFHGLNEIFIGAAAEPSGLSETEQLEALRDTLGDTASQEALLSGIIHIPIDEKSLRALSTPEALNNRLNESRAFAYSVLNDASASLETLIDAKNTLFEDINLVRIAQGRELAKNTTDLDPVWRAFFISLDEKIAKAGGKPEATSLAREPGQKVKKALSRKKAEDLAATRKLQGDELPEIESEVSEKKRELKQQQAPTEPLDYTVKTPERTNGTKKLPSRMQAASSPSRGPNISEKVRQNTPPESKKKGGIIAAASNLWNSIWQ